MATNNHSCSRLPAEKAGVLNISLMLVLSVAITLGNVISLTVFLGSRRYRTPQGYLKASLATADLAVGVLVIPYSVHTEIKKLLVGGGGPVAGPPPPRDPGPGGFRPCYLIGPVFAGCTFVSVFTIFLLSVERSITVLRPLHKNVVVTKDRTLVVIGVSWLFCFALAVSPLLLSADIILEYSACSKMCNYALSSTEPPQHTRDQSAAGGGWSVMLLFPAFDFSLLGATYLVNLVTFCAVQRFCRARKNILTKAQRSHRGPAFSDLQAAKTILILSAFLSVSVAPVAVLVVGSVAGGADWCWFSLCAFWILACSSAWNVLIYSARDRRFWLKVRELFLGRRGGRGVRRRPPGGVSGTCRTPTLGATPGHPGRCQRGARRGLTSELHVALSSERPETSITMVSRQGPLSAPSPSTPGRFR
ncbi:beta-3 adrenergic receptor-like [Hypomesus transpacificus]|uniref:beta-3 adrenergic receptor-like n=1 Tax=Hypomesus transpacificus TaxID=137520 RepID=UPI001F086DF1|nr:beta-3 adrenergic receptor-like [Hypomesus transpacificus]